MNMIQSTEAKARFAELLRIVEQGETVVITRHGRVVAQIIPAHETEEEDYRQVAARFCRRLEELEPVHMSIEEILGARHEGHRY